MDLSILKIRDNGVPIFYWMLMAVHSISLKIFFLFAMYFFMLNYFLLEKICPKIIPAAIETFKLSVDCEYSNLGIEI